MSENIGESLHRTGKFKIGEDEIAGELIYNSNRGTILLNLERQLGEGNIFPCAVSPFTITGTLNSGECVCFLDCSCLSNTIQLAQSQQLIYSAKFLIVSRKYAADKLYNRYVCKIINALSWSELSRIKVKGSSFVEFDFQNPTDNMKVYNWYGAKVSFYTSIKNELSSLPRKEESKITERLVLSIETKEKKDAFYFIDIQKKITSLISFAIKDNVNIEDQCLLDSDDNYSIDTLSMPNEYYLYTSGQQPTIYENSSNRYSFFLNQFSSDNNIQKKLDLLEPVFNLYLSLFKYSDMPTEMVFLNIVQALETFHSRFFYNNRKEKYIDSVKERFGNRDDSDFFENLLLPIAQRNSNHIILASRINDLLIGDLDCLFIYYYTYNNFAQTVVETRNYYTHYDKSKENKALKGEDLIHTIRVLTLLLDFHVCKELGIDIKDKIRQSLSLLQK